MILLLCSVFIFFIVFITLFHSIYLIKQAEVVIIERLGKYHKTLHSGIHLTIPFFDVPRTVLWTFIKEIEGKRYYRFNKIIDRIDLRETVYDFPKQNVITKDNVAIEINALLYYQITDPKSAIYMVSNLAEAIEKLTHSTLRNVIGSMDLDESLVSRDRINAKLRIILDEATDKWGIKINRVELQDITPPHDIRDAMEKQMRAERERRAIILEAEGAKRASILKAEGDQEAQILQARGAAQAQILRAEAEATARLAIADAEAQALKKIEQSLPHSSPAQYLLTLQYIQMLPKIAEGDKTKIMIIPQETSAALGSIGIFKELFTEGNSK